MKNINIMNKGSWANKGVSIFTSIALVMAVVSPLPAYAAETEDVATQDGAIVMTLAEGNAADENATQDVSVAKSEDISAEGIEAEDAAANEASESAAVEAEIQVDEQAADEAGKQDAIAAEESIKANAGAEASAVKDSAAPTTEAQRGTGEAKAEDNAKAQADDNDKGAGEVKAAREVKANEITAADSAKASEQKAANVAAEEPKAARTVKAASAAAMAPAAEEAPATVGAPVADEANEAKAAPEAAPEAAPKAAPKATVTLGQFQVQGEDGAYAYENGILTIMGDIVVNTTEKTNERIVVADNATVTFGGVEIETSAAAAAITVNAGVSALFNLMAGTVNTVTGGKNHAGIEAAWQNANNYADLTIQGEGTLNATGGAGNGGAGIGGSSAEKAVHGNITIDGGTINAQGTGRSAGIGSSGNPVGSYKYTENVLGLDSLSQWGSIVVNGGDVTAKGVSNGAGIGGGNHMDSGIVVINGGTVCAEGDSGIGSGLGSSKDKGAGGEKGPGYYYADVTINGGNVTAYATDNMGAGIGGGMYGDGIVTINGGTVVASVNLNGKSYQGGAGIGGGYQGAGAVTITGGDVTAYGGNGSAGIGNGALAAITTSSKYSDADGWTGTKNVRSGMPTVAGEDIKVEITGGTVQAFGGYAGAGIGSGNSSEWSNVIISGGDVYAVGYASTEDEMEGAAGIGSGASWVQDKIAYMKETIETITITGGNVIAIGGWGAAGIGSGAKNQTADSITIDAENANVQAYADGTKFAIDTPADAAGSNVSVAGNVLQGTFVHEYEDSEGNIQGTEGLSSIILKDEATGMIKQLVLMPEGYRSYATDVANPGIYAVYTDSATIGDSGEDASGNGAHFSVYATDQWSGDEEGNKPVTYGVVTDELSNYLYLFPVKTVVVETAIEIAGAADQATEELAASVNKTFHFAIHNHKGDVLTDADGNPWIQTIEIVNGVAQGSVYFANMNDGMFEIWEVDENGNSLATGEQYGNLILTSIRTEHGEGADNNAEISKSIWKDVVRIVNTFVPVPVDPVDPVDPAEPVEPVAPVDPVNPVEPVTPAEPVAPVNPETPETPEVPADPSDSETPVVPAGPTNPADPAEPTAPAAPAAPTAPAAPAGSDEPAAPASADEPEAPEAPETPEAPAAPAGPAAPQGSDEQPEPAAPIAPAGPTTPSTPAGPTTPSTPAGPTTPATPTAPMAITAGTIAETAVSTAATVAAAATTTGAVAEAAAPAATAPVAQEAIAEEAVPLASAADDENPLAGHDHEDCWVHWWIILGMLATAAYSLAAIVRRKNDSDELRSIEREALGLDELDEAPAVPELKLNPQPTA